MALDMLDPTKFTQGKQDVAVATAAAIEVQIFDADANDLGIYIRRQLGQIGDREGDAQRALDGDDIALDSGDLHDLGDRAVLARVPAITGGPGGNESGSPISIGVGTV